MLFHQVQIMLFGLFGRFRREGGIKETERIEFADDLRRKLRERFGLIGNLVFHIYLVFNELNGFINDFVNLLLVGNIQRGQSAHLLQLAQSRQDLRCDEAALGHALHPRPAARIVLVFFHHLQGFGLLEGQADSVEHYGELRALLLHVFGLQHPRRFFQHDGLQFGVLLQFGLQSIGRLHLPLADIVHQLRDVVGNVGRQGVGIEHIERVFGAIHIDAVEVRQGLHGIPHGVGAEIQGHAVGALTLARCH